jgi:hypothetical protein
MEMFDPKVLKERIGDMKKSSTLNVLEDVEEYLLRKLKKYDFVGSYDVIANELPYFKTLNYTEYAHCFIMHPLCQDLRVRQIVDAYDAKEYTDLDYVTYFKDKILNNSANKYQNMTNDKDYETRQNLVVLAGSNVLKDRICLNKLKWIAKTHEHNVWFKPHPITTHAVIGELKDLLGEENILPRSANMYYFLMNSERVYSSHISESALYSVALDKILEPSDVYNRIEQGSFYHINKFLFTTNNPKEWVNKTFNSYKSGIINPAIDENWKEKIDNYLEYINDIRESYKNKYIEQIKKRV